PAFLRFFPSFPTRRSSDLAFLGSASFLAFWLYLTKILQYLDPSQSVPKHVRSALDTLAEGLLVIDASDRIVLANDAFAAMVGRRDRKSTRLNSSHQIISYA